MNITTFYPNGSLYPTLNKTDLWRALPVSNLNPNINFTAFPNNTNRLEFNSLNGNFTVALPMVSMLLSSTALRIHVWCTYPLSGQYDVLPRVLYYTALVATMVFRRSTWISSAALGTAMAYSAVAAIHFFVLLSKYEWREGYWNWDAITSFKHGDIDFMGIIPVLSAASVMLAPMSLWSTTFRKHRSRPLIVVWGLLIFSALVPSLWLLNKYIHGQWTPNQIPSFAFCTGTDPKCTWQNLNVESDKFTYELYNRCGCSDFCAVVSPATPLRSGLTMVADLARKISKRTSNTDTYVYLSITVMVIWVSATIHGLLALSMGTSSQPDVRNAVFRFLYASRRDFLIALFRGERQRALLRRWNCETPDTKTGRWWTVRRAFALFWAGFAYTVSLVAAVVYPLAFVATVVINELMVAGFPVSEHSDAVGAWSPWLGAGLVVIAALVAGHPGRIAALFWWICLGPVNLVRYGEEDRPKLKDAVRRRRGEERHVGIGSGLRSARGGLRDLGEAFKERMSEFATWIRDPVEGSKVKMRNNSAHNGQMEEEKNQEKRMSRMFEDDRVHLGTMVMNARTTGNRNSVSW